TVDTAKKKATGINDFNILPDMEEIRITFD
ncbi:MAG: hypothetical protein ACI8SE_001253, partial [Bacteroidia bacterium]